MFMLVIFIKVKPQLTYAQFARWWDSWSVIGSEDREPTSRHAEHAGRLFGSVFGSLEMRSRMISRKFRQRFVDAAYAHLSPWAMLPSSIGPPRYQKVKEVLCVVTVRAVFVFRGVFV